MILDAFLQFTGTINGAAGGITSTRFTDAPTTGTQVASNIIDLGIGSSANPAIPSLAAGGGARDVGSAPEWVPLILQAAVAVAFTSGTSLQLQLQGAPDDGTGAPGAYTTMWTGEAVIEANLDIGAQLANVTVPRVVPGQVLPRFLRLNFITVGTHVLGQVNAGIVLDALHQPQGADAALSGYPAGLNVAN